LSWWGELPAVDLAQAGEFEVSESERRTSSAAPLESRASSSPAAVLASRSSLSSDGGDKKHMGSRAPFPALPIAQTAL